MRIRRIQKETESGKISGLRFVPRRSFGTMFENEDSEDFLDIQYLKNLALRFS